MKFREQLKVVNKLVKTALNGACASFFDRVIEI